jgi:hypothetical protein
MLLLIWISLLQISQWEIWDWCNSHGFSIRGRMVDKLTRIPLSTSRSFDLFFDLIVFKVEKSASHRYDLEKGSKISEALFTIAGYSFLRESWGMSWNFDFRVVSEETPINSFYAHVRSDSMFVLCSPEAPNGKVTHSTPFVETDGKYRICACISCTFLRRIYPPKLGCGLYRNIMSFLRLSPRRRYCMLRKSQ